MYALSDIFNWSIDAKSEIDYHYHKCRPSIVTIFKIILSIIEVKNTVKKIKSINLEINGHAFDGTFIKEDFIQTLTDSNTVKNIIDLAWLREYFSEINFKTNFFFKDEFYLIGKIISSASKINCKNIRTYGIQHNAIDKTHYTYRLSKYLIIKNNNHF